MRKYDNRGVSLFARGEKKIIQCIKTGIGMVICFAAIVVATYGAFIGSPASLHYHISERYSLTAAGRDATIYLGILVPQSGPYQTVENMELTWEGEQVWENTPCIDVIKLSGLVSAGTSQEALLEYDVSVSHGFVFWRAEPDSCQLSPDCLIESDHPEIVKKASQITQGASWWDAYKIYSFTDHYLVALEDDADCTRNVSALEAYQTGRGACGEYSRLMVAFCRASKIPSLVASGIMLPDFGPFAGAHTRIWDHPGVAHAWVEFADNNIWTIADPAWGAGTWDILYFGRNDGRHLSYGCINHEGEVYTQVRQWANRHGSPIAQEFAALKFVAAADPHEVTIKPVVTVREGWDGRWLNAVMVLVATTFMLCCVRNRFFRKRDEDSL